MKYNTEEDLQQAIEKYFVERNKKGLPGTVESLCFELGITRQTLINYSKNEKFFDTIQNAKMRIQSDFIDYILVPDNKISAAIPIFLLKNNFGYEDKSEVKQSFEIEF